MSNSIRAFVRSRCPVIRQVIPGISWRARSKDLLVWGDIVHVASIQLQNPKASVEYDTDAAAAAAQRSRRYAFELAAKKQVGPRPCFGVAKRHFRLWFDVSGHGVAPETGMRTSTRKSAGCYWTTSERLKQKPPQAQGFTGFLGLLRITSWCQERTRIMSLTD